MKHLLVMGFKLGYAGYIPAPPHGLHSAVQGRKLEYQRLPKSTVTLTSRSLTLEHSHPLFSGWYLCEFK